MPGRELYKEVLRELSNDTWRFGIDVSQRLVVLLWGFSNGCLFITLTVNEEQEIITVKIRFERKCPPTLRKGMATWCGQANWKLQFGFFFCDQNDGETSFKDSMDVEDLPVTAQFLRRMIERAAKTVETYYLEVQCVMSA
jgi:hypothetical protein